MVRPTPHAGPGACMCMHLYRNQQRVSSLRHTAITQCIVDVNVRIPTAGWPDREAAVADPQIGRRAASAAEKAAGQLLEARSLFIAGQAGLCCNPRCAG